MVRRIAAWLFFTLALPLVAIAATLFAFQLTFGTPAFVKRELATVGTYEKLERVSPLIAEGAIRNLEPNAQKALAPTLRRLSREVLTASLWKGKIEGFLDEANDWLRGRREELPGADLGDIKAAALERVTGGERRAVEAAFGQLPDRLSLPASPQTENFRAAWRQALGLAPVSATFALALLGLAFLTSPASLGRRIQLLAWPLIIAGLTFGFFLLYPLAFFHAPAAFADLALERPELLTGGKVSFDVQGVIRSTALASFKEISPALRLPEMRIAFGLVGAGILDWLTGAAIIVASKIRKPKEGEVKSEREEDSIEESSPLEE